MAILSSAGRGETVGGEVGTGSRAERSPLGPAACSQTSQEYLTSPETSHYHRLTFGCIDSAMQGKIVPPGAPNAE